MPMKQRVPKLRGFNNPFRVEYQGINLDVIDETGLDEVSPEVLHGHGLTHKGALDQGPRPRRDQPRRHREGTRVLPFG